LISIYEQYLRRYPHEYLWTYKIYKYSRQKELLIISDGKVGHLRQSEGAAKLTGQMLLERKINPRIFTVQVEFRNRLCRFILPWLASFSGCCLGSGNGLRYLRICLTPQSYQELSRYNPDIVISAGGSPSAVNYLLCGECRAKSIALMRPGILSLRKFDLTVIPRHDLSARAWLGWLNKNLVVTEGALNLIDAQYLQEKVKGLKQSGLLKAGTAKFCIGVLIGGDSRKFKLDPAAISKLAQEIKKSAARLDADILISTSRRSSPAVEAVIRDEFADYARCRLLVIANRQNHPDAVGGILGLSHLVISSPESISMISEAASAGKYTVVFNCANLSIKHGRFLENYRQKGYIYLEETSALSVRVEQLLQDQPEIKFPQDNLKVIAGINKIL
jgi:mitochondrial fission protein ELM1